MLILAVEASGSNWLVYLFIVWLFGSALGGVGSIIKGK